MKRGSAKSNGDVGTCLKTMDRTVLKQNSACIKFCGKKIGERCDVGCMVKFASEGSESKAELGFHVVQNLKNGEQTFDAIVINDGGSLNTLLLPKDNFINKMLSVFESNGLTSAELAVVALILEGHTNREIAKRLFVCPQTLKTHINNINKKVPKSLGINKLRHHFRLEF